MLGSLILYLKGMRIMMFQLSSFYYRVPLKGSLKGFYKGSIIGFYNIGALVIRIGFWGPLYYSYNNKEPPKIVLVIIAAPFFCSLRHNRV